METFAPDFSKVWLPEAATPPAESGRAEDDAGNLKAALQDLVDLVNAARSIL